MRPIYFAKLSATLCLLFLSVAATSAEKGKPSKPGSLLEMVNEVVMTNGPLQTPSKVSHKIKTTEENTPFDAKQINTPLQVIYWAEQTLATSKIGIDKFSSRDELEKHSNVVLEKLKPNEAIPIEAECSPIYDAKKQNYKVLFFNHDSGKFLIWTKGQEGKKYIAKNAFGKDVVVTKSYNQSILFSPENINGTALSRHLDKRRDLSFEFPMDSNSARRVDSQISCALVTKLVFPVITDIKLDRYEPTIDDPKEYANTERSIFGEIKEVWIYAKDTGSLIAKFPKSE